MISDRTRPGGNKLVAKDASLSKHFSKLESVSVTKFKLLEDVLGKQMNRLEEYVSNLKWGR